MNTTKVTGTMPPPPPTPPQEGALLIEDKPAQAPAPPAPPAEAKAEPAPKLPATASPIPLIGLLGALMLLATGVGFARFAFARSSVASAWFGMRFSALSITNRTAQRRASSFKSHRGL